MGRLKVHGGDFAKGRAWFSPRVGFLLRNMNGERESILVENLVVAYDATEKAIRKLGGDDLLVDEFGRVPASDKAGQHLLVVSFNDGRLLLASASPRSYREIRAKR